MPDTAWRLRKAKGLVKALAVVPEHRLHRELVCDRLWPDRDLAAALNNLHQAIFVARRVVVAAGGSADWLRMREDTVAVAPTGVRFDVEAYQSAAADAKRNPSIESHSRAVALYTGDLLPEDLYEDWTEAPRRALRELQQGLLLELAELHAEANDAVQAASALHAAVLHDPLDEEAHRRLIRLYAATGRRQQALAQYQQLRHALRRELEAEPDPETRRLYQSVLSGGVAAAAERSAPAPVALVAEARGGERLDNLPLQLTSFVGREGEVAAIGAALGRARLLTLVGTAGSGKTRLAVETAATLLGRHRDGLWLVELAGLQSPELVVLQLGSVLKLELRSERDPLEFLLQRLRERQLLLVLDNCEHLVATVADLCRRLLAACPDVTILATSREPLRVEGEVAWPVLPLGLPDASAPIVRAELLASAAVRLFCERAAAARADFAFTDENAGPIRDICSRLAGLPLAIELAAARVRSLSPTQIASRLGDTVDLDATLTWSHDLLDASERALFRRLSVFAGTFSAEAAAVVCGEPGALERLVDRSLVMTEELAGAYRYRMLEPIRQYARLRLLESGEAERLEDRHLDWALELARSTDAYRRGGPRSVPVRALEADHDNLRAALGVALRRRPEAALELVVALFPFWMQRAYFTEGSAWTEAALAACEGRPELGIGALHTSAGFAIRRGRTSAVLPRAARAVELLRPLGDPWRFGYGLDHLAVCSALGGGTAEAEQTLAELDALLAVHDMPDLAAAAAHTRGLLRYGQGEYMEAAVLLELAIAAMERVPLDLGPVYWVTTIGFVLVDDVSRGRPRLYFEDTLQHFRRVPGPAAVGYLRADLARVLRSAGRVDQALKEQEQALSEMHEFGDHTGIALATTALGNAFRTAGELEVARELLEEALVLHRRLGDRRATLMTAGGLGILAGRSGDLELAHARFAEVQRLAEQADDVAAAAGSQISLGSVELEYGSPARAAAAYRQGIRLLNRQLIARGVAWAYEALGEALAATGDAAAARRAFEQARDRFESLGDRRGLDLLASLAVEAGLRGR